MSERTTIAKTIAALITILCTCTLIRGNTCPSDQPDFFFPANDTLETPGTFRQDCKKKCGSPCVNPMQHFGCRCSCDSQCIIYGDCCEGFTDDCLEEAEKGERFMAKMFPEEVPQASCTEGHLVISSCPSSWPKDDIRQKCSHRLNNVTTMAELTSVLHLAMMTPMMSKQSGLFYRNMFCAKCNYDDDFDEDTSSIEFLCNDNVNQTKIGLEGILQAGTTLGCTLDFSFANGYASRRCVSAINDCPDNCQWSIVRRLCKASYNLLECNNSVYKNRYCAYCNLGYNPVESCDEYERYDTARSGFFSFSVLFSLRKDQSLSASIRVANARQIVFSSKSRCSRGLCLVQDCPFGYKRGVSECNVLDLYEETLYSFDVLIKRPVNSFDISISFAEYLATVMKSEKVDLPPLWGFRGKDSYDCAEIHNTNLSESDAKNSSLQFVYAIVKLTNAVEQQMSFNMPKPPRFVYIPDFNLYLKNNNLSNFAAITGITISMSTNLTTSFCGFPRPQRLDTCDKATIPSDHWAIRDRHSVWVKTTSTSDSALAMDESNIRFEGDAIIVCSDDLRVYTDTEKTALERGLEIFNMVILGLSLLCVLIRLVLQGFIPSFHRVSGKMQFVVAFALFWFLVFLAVGLTLWKTKLGADVLQPVTILCHFSLLCVFSSHFALSVFTYESVCKPLHFRAESSGVKYRNFGLQTIIPPVVISVTGVSLQYFHVSDPWNPHFGRLGPWLYSNLGLIILVLVPIGLITVVNIILFVFIVVALSHTVDTRRRMRTNQEQEAKQAFILCLRIGLFMGALWSVLLVDFFVDHPVLEVITTIVFGGQGIIIFLLTCCTLPARQEFLRCCKGIQGRRSSTATVETPMTNSSDKDIDYSSTATQSHQSSDNL